MKTFLYDDLPPNFQVENKVKNETFSAAEYMYLLSQTYFLNTNKRVCLKIRERRLPK